MKLLDRLRIFAEGCPPIATGSAANVEFKEAGGWPRLSLTRILAGSPSMRGLLEEKETVGEGHVRAWIKYWQDKEFVARA